MKSDAILSSCGLYRYKLTRYLEENNDKCLLFIMLNPATADAEKDDNTIRRCIGYTRRLGYGVLNVVNLFDYRTDSPAVLKKALNPVSPNNLEWIVTEAKKSDLIICAWGGHGRFLGQNKVVLDALKSEKIKLHALEILKSGDPKHPLYASYDKEIVLLS